MYNHSNTHAVNHQHELSSSVLFSTSDPDSVITLIYSHTLNMANYMNIDEKCIDRRYIYKDHKARMYQINIKVQLTVHGCTIDLHTCIIRVFSNPQRGAEASVSRITAWGHVSEKKCLLSESSSPNRTWNLESSHVKMNNEVLQTPGMGDSFCLNQLAARRCLAAFTVSISRL